MSLLERAIALALEAHRGQVDRYGRPYILHPLYLMSQMESLAEMVTAVLHDVVEDTDYTLEDLQEQLGIGEEIATAVALLTHDKQATPYDEYVSRLKSNPIACRVKLADLRHNMDIRRMDEVRPKDMERLNKYRRAWEILVGERRDD